MNTVPAAPLTTALNMDASQASNGVRPLGRFAWGRSVVMALACGAIMVVSGSLPVAGCGTEPAPNFRQPECEPPEELVLERTLKVAFRHAFEGRNLKAIEAFDRVLALDPAHPEARAGRRAVQTTLTSPSNPRSSAPASPSPLKSLKGAPAGSNP